MSTRITYRFIRKTVSRLFLCAILSLGATASLQSVYGQQNRLFSATHDSLVDPNNPTTNYNTDRLEVTYSNFPDFVTTRRSLLQFDLSTANVPLTAAALSLTIIETNLLASSSVDLALYAAEDGWDETNVNWESRPNQGDLLQTIAVSAGISGTLHFDAAAVGTYIENQRAGDHVASFLLTLDGGTDPLGFGGNVIFENREGSADGVNGNEPVITVVGGESETNRIYLPTIQR